MITLVFIPKFGFNISAMIVSRRTNKWRRSREFYPTFYYLYDATFGQCFTLNFDYSKCPACDTPYTKENTKVTYKIKKHSGEKIYSNICEDCQKDNKSTDADY